MIAAKAWRALRSAPARAAVLMVRLYQTTLSPLLGGRCRFVPSCSEYCIEAVRTRGVVVGGLMGLWRILRCHPLARGGYDPVDRSAIDVNDAARTQPSDGR